MAEAGQPYCYFEKRPKQFWGQSGRMINPSNRKLTVELIQEANRNEVRLAKACEELHISVRTYEPCIKDRKIQLDKRSTVKQPIPQKNYPKKK